MVQAHAEGGAGQAVQAGLDDGQRLRARAGAGDALLVGVHRQRQPQRIHCRINRAAALPLQREPGAVDRYVDLDAAAVAGQAVRVVRHQARHALGLAQVGGLEQCPEGIAGHLGLARVGGALHHGAELHLHAPWHDHALVTLQQEGDAALARLAVHADHAVVGAAQVRRVDGQVRNLPRALGVVRGEAFLDRVLVRARERGEHQVARVGVAWVDGQARALFGHARHGVDVGKIQSRVHALGVEVERHRHQVEVAAALAVAKQAAFHALGARQQGQLGRRHARAAVVVRVHRKHDVLARHKVAVHPLDLVGKAVGRGVFHRGGQVDDDLAPGAHAPGGQRGLAGLERHLQLGGVEGFG